MVRSFVKSLASPKRWIRRHKRRRKLKMMANQNPCRIVVGASGIVPDGWAGSEVEDLNLLDPDQWSEYFRPESVDSIVAEHVWEHLTLLDGFTAAITCYQYLRPYGYLRVAVPDGWHPDPEYVDAVKPGGSGAGSDDHQVLYNHESLAELFSAVGFEILHLEHFDQQGKFHYSLWDPDDGMIRRSRRFDWRNTDEELNYTSVILDAVKVA